eukprot:292370-Hanusia_phi.AAC.1
MRYHLDRSRTRLAAHNRMSVCLLHRGDFLSRHDSKETIAVGWRCWRWEHEGGRPSESQFSPAAQSLV